MIKFAISLLAFSVWLLAFPATIFAQTATLSLDPSNGTFNQGCSFSLNVYLDTGGAQTDGTDAYLFYDPSRLTATSITNGTIYPDYAGSNIDSQKGTIAISGYIATSTHFSGKGVLATVNFTVPNTAPAGATQVNFDFDPNNKAKTTDSNVIILQQGTVVDVLNSVLNGNYILGTGTCSPQPSATPTPTPGGGGTTQPAVTPPPGFSYGRGGPGVIATPSANYPPATYVPMKTLPNGGTAEFTAALAIFGSILTTLGILGLAFL